MALGISIIMPVYNVAGYVTESLASVQAQTCRDWELIVVNDGSTDGTEERVRAVAEGDPRIRLVNQPNAGVSRARNRGLELATGDFLAFLDGDDLWHERTLAEALRAMEGAGTEAFFCGVDRLHPDGSRMPVSMEVPPDGSRSEALVELHFQGRVMLLMGNLVFRVTPRLRALRFTEGCRRAEDTEYLLEALASVGTNFSFREEALLVYRVRPGSATQQPWDWRVMVDTLQAQDRAIGYLKEHAGEGLRSRLQVEDRRLLFSHYRFLYRMRA